MIIFHFMIKRLPMAWEPHDWAGYAEFYVEGIL